MTEIMISASKEYSVLIERGLLDRAGELMAACLKGCRAVIVSDDNVFPLYGERLETSLEKADIQVRRFVVPHGERSKSLACYGELLGFLSENHFSRADALVALGGGVVGDLTGFAAATYQRGMGFVQVPTTLLAAVDSSVGGKTAVNLPTGKNQVGAFYQPSLVICDPDTLKTLPEAEYKCGCAEVIKYGVLGSERFFNELRERPVSEQLAHVIKTCVEMKRDVVIEDEFDHGRRQLLNLGHTAGHAVEACSGFTVLHGQAVAIGMAVITGAAVKKGLCSPETLEKLLDILDYYGLPVTADYPLEDMARAVLADKKLAGATINLVVPERIGRSCVMPVPVSEIKDWLRLGGVK